MMLLCGLATKNTPVFSGLTSPFLQIGGNNPTVEEFQTRTLPFARQSISARHGDVTVQASTADADDDTVERPHVSDRQGGLKYKN